MSAPQITLLVLFALELGAVIAKSGQPRTDKYSVGLTVVSLGIVLLILHWGGFFARGAE